MKYEAQRDIEHKVSCIEYSNIYAEPHFHRCIEMIYVLSGQVNINISACEDIILQDEIAFVPSYHVHFLKSMEGTKSITFMIPYNYYEEFIKRGNNLHFYHLSNKEVNKKLLTIMQACFDEQNNDSILLRGYIDVLLGLIDKNYEQFDYETEDNNLMIDIIQYIDSHISEKITLDDISKHFTYSKYYFSRLFNRLFGCNLNYYINQVRYNNFVKNFDKTKSITNQIVDNGFGDISTFYKLKQRKSHTN